MKAQTGPDGACAREGTSAQSGAFGTYRCARLPGTAGVAVPRKKTFWVPASSVMVTWPVRAPEADGLKNTQILHSSPDGRNSGQSCVPSKSPLAASRVICSGSSPPLLSTISCRSLAVAAVCVAKTTRFGVTPAMRILWPTAAGTKSSAAVIASHLSGFNRRCMRGEAKVTITVIQHLHCQAGVGRQSEQNQYLGGSMRGVAVTLCRAQPKNGGWLPQEHCGELQRILRRHSTLLPLDSADE